VVLGRRPASGAETARLELREPASPVLVRRSAGELEVETRNRIGGFLDSLGDVISRGMRTTVEFDVERKFRETRLYSVAPINNNLVLAYVGQHVLGMPRSY